MPTMKAKSPVAKGKSVEVPSIKTPPPQQVLSDLIDATCHLILSLDGGDGRNSLPPPSSFNTLAQQLKYYIDELYDKSTDEPQLKAGTARARLFLAKLVLDVCARSAYPSEEEGDEEADTSKLDPLMEMSGEECENLLCELGMVADNFPSMESDDSASLDNLIFQVEALESLAKLKSQLSSKIAEIKEGGGKSPTKMKVKFSAINGHIEQYKAEAEEMKEKFAPIEGKNLFLPSKLLSMKRCSTIERVKQSAKSIVKGIDDMVANFPLEALQTSLWELFRKLEEDHLPVPILFQIGYFQFDSSNPSKASRKQSAESTTPVSPSATSSNGQGFTRSQRKKPLQRRNQVGDSDDDQKTTKIIRTKRNADDVFDFEPDEEEDVELELKPSNKKKKTRISYSDEEKRALLDGVAKFGAGKWKQICDHYDSVFSLNCRTPVNLKDLYRTLTKK